MLLKALVVSNGLYRVSFNSREFVVDPMIQLGSMDSVLSCICRQTFAFAT